jgi:hypothetical protein
MVWLSSLSGLEVGESFRNEILGCAAVDLKQLAGDPARCG